MASARALLIDAWYRGSWWLYLLRPLEFLFRGVAALRRAAYGTGLLSAYRATRPVVVVGSITAGGSGKTPVVVALVESLRAQGLVAGVVSRGYGAAGTAFPYNVTARSTAQDCGDEALMIFQRAGCPVVVDPARAVAARTLVARHKVDLVISDDGLQHYALSRDMEIAVLDAQLRCGNGFCLPAGPLREPPRRLRQVDFVLYRGSAKSEDGVLYGQRRLVHLRSGEERTPLALSAGGAVYAVAGIGHPEQFFESLEQMGFTLLRRTFADHHAYRIEDFSEMAGHPIIMTEKDAVKCRAFAGDNAWYLEVTAQLPARVVSAVAALARH